MNGTQSLDINTQVPAMLQTIYGPILSLLFYIFHFTLQEKENCFSHSWYSQFDILLHEEKLGGETFNNSSRKSAKVVRHFVAKTKCKIMFSTHQV